MIRINQVTPAQWKQLSEHAHRVCFGEIRPASDDRIDYALLAVNDFDIPMGYITVRENDSRNIYWQFGGAFPQTKKTILSFYGYAAMRDWCADRYDSIRTLIHNENIVMLKFAMKVGFRISGVSHVFGKTYAEMFLDLRKEK